MFYQEPFGHPDLFEVDAALQQELARRLPGAHWAELQPRLRALGRETTREMPILAATAEADPPRHVPFDPWGRRVDQLWVSPAWTELGALAARHQVVATGVDPAWGRWARLAQMAKLYLYSGSSATFSCPLAMTDAAAQVLRRLAPPELQAAWVPRLLAREPSRMATSGQWMTERAGGSDVGRTETVARPAGAGRYQLHGVKWFTSATTAEMALTLARIDDGRSPPAAGSRGLSLFHVALERTAQGGFRGIRVERLKDKLGTRALPTAELALEGVEATLLGEPGRGVANISTMLNVTRYYNAVASASLMALGVALAEDYARRRQSFGRPIAEHPLHRRTLESLRAEAAGAMALCAELAEALGRVEVGEASPEDEAYLRALLPIAKATLGKAVVAHASEVIECFGGAGYVEDTGIPRLLRDAQVLPIWEGTTNVLSLDLLRAQGREGGLTVLLEKLTQRAEALGDLAGAARVRALTRDQLGWVQAISGDPEPMARDLTLNLGSLLQVILLGEAAQAQGEGALDRFSRLMELRFGGPIASWISRRGQ